MSLFYRSHVAVLPALQALVPSAGLVLASLALVALATPAAHAQANLTFSGGSGTPLTLTLAAPVTYTVTPDANGVFAFNFVGVGNLFNDSFPDITSTLTYAINGGTQQTIESVNSGRAGGDVSANDVYAFSSSVPSVNAGDTVVLFAGSLTTTINVTAAAPQSGSYSTFLISGRTGTRISNVSSAPTAAAAPEPGSIALLLTAGVPVVGIVRRRKDISKKH